MHFRPRFLKIFGFFEDFVKFLGWVLFYWCYMIMHCIPLALSQCFIHLDICLIVENSVLVGLDWALTHDAIIFSMSHVHAYFMHTLSFLSLYSFVTVFSLSLSLSLSQIDCAWHPSANLIRLGTLFVLGLLHLLIFPFTFFMFDSVMRRPIRTSLRTFLNVVFIQSAMWFCWTFPTLLYPMSFKLRDGNLSVRYPCGVPSWSYRSFTPICAVSIPLYLSLPRYSEVHVS